MPRTEFLFVSLSHLLSATTIIVIKNVPRFSTPLAVSQSLIWPSEQFQA